MVVWRYDDPSPSLSPPFSIATSESVSTSTNTSPALQQQPHDSSRIAFATSFLTPSQGSRGVDWVRQGVGWMVAVQNLEALRILLGGGYLSAGALVLAGELGKWVVRRVVLGAVGLGEV